MVDRKRLDRIDHRREKVLLLPLLLLAVCCIPRAGSSQSIEGRILDEKTGSPVPMAVVVLLGPEASAAAQTLSASDGAFRLESPAAGFFSLKVSGLGFAEFQSSVFALEEDETVTVEIEVLADPLPLESIRIEVTGNRGRDRFRRRLDRGIGFFLDRGQLDALDPVDMIDIFRAVEDVQVSWAFTRQDDGGSRPLPTVRAGPHGCMNYMLDDRPVRGGIGDNRSPLALFPLSGVRMSDIQAVEVYRDLSEVPPELRNSAFRPVWGNNLSYWEKTCGVTVFRTKVRW